MERDYNHGDEAWANMLIQFRRSPAIESLVKAIYQPVNALHSAFFDLAAKRWLDTAEGVQLDRIGDIVGLTRTLSNAQIVDFFGFDTQTAVKGFAQARLRRQYEGRYGGTETLPDYEYRLLLRWKIAVNNGHGTAAEIVDALNTILGSQMLRLGDVGNAKIQVVVNGEGAPEYILNNLPSLFMAAAGVGVEVVRLTEVNPFGFYDQSYSSFGDGVLISDREIIT